jgi:hypothetical protein
LRITDPNEDADDASFSQGGGRPQPSSGTASIMSELKKTSTVTTREPDEGAPVPKAKAKIDGSRLREMLANINTERD